MRIINGMGISLCLSRLLIFASKFIQNPHKHKIAYMHIGWVIIVFLWIIQFWWDYLMQSGQKQLDVYTYIIDLLYVFGLFFVCVAITPDDVTEYGDYERYFVSRKGWFFSLFIFLNCLEYISQARFYLSSGDYAEVKSDTISLIIETLGIIAAIKINNRKFQFFLIWLIIAGSLSDFLLPD